MTLFPNQFRLRSARSKELVKGFAAMQASALQRTLVMKANFCSFEPFASSLSSCFGESPNCVWSPEVRLKGHNKALTTVYTLLLCPGECSATAQVVHLLR